MGNGYKFLIYYILRYRMFKFGGMLKLNQKECNFPLV